MSDKKDKEARLAEISAAQARMRDAFARGLKERGLDPEKIAEETRAERKAATRAAPDPNSHRAEHVLPIQAIRNKINALQKLLLPEDIQALLEEAPKRTGFTPREILKNALTQVAADPKNDWLLDETIAIGEVDTGVGGRRPALMAKLSEVMLGPLNLKPRPFPGT